MLCYRCGSHVPDGNESCGSCGQKFALGLKPGPIAGFGPGTRRHRMAVESSPVKVGEVVAGRYEIREQVGAGPLGWLFKCLDLDADEELALKLLSPRLMPAPEDRPRLFAALAGVLPLVHPNIARLFEVAEDNGHVFLTLEHLEGLTLRRIWDLRRQKNQLFQLKEVEPLVAQLASALDFAHARGQSHGGLKPDNLVVLPELLKITDFGLANALPRAPFMSAQKTGGVHRYLAPEFLHGERIELRADVYSVGVIVSEMLSGMVFEPGSLPELSQALKSLVAKAVAFKPYERFASVGELSLALSEAAGVARRGSSSPAPARPPPPPLEPEAGPAPTSDESELTDEFEGFEEDEDTVVAALPPPAPAPKEEEDHTAFAPLVPSKKAPPAAPLFEEEEEEVTVFSPPEMPKPPALARPPPPVSPSSPSIPKLSTKLPPPVLAQSEAPSKAPYLVAALLVLVIAGVFAYLSYEAMKQRSPEAREEESPAQAELGTVEEPESPAPAEEPKAPPVEKVAAPAKPAPKTQAPRPAEEKDSLQKEEERRRAEALARIEEAKAPEPLKVALPQESEEAKPPEPPKVEVAAPLAAVVTASAKEPSCPAGMRLVPEGSFRFGAPDSDDLKGFGELDEARVSTKAYCIDVYEHPNRARGRPKTGLGWTQASAACAAEQKRLCTEQEWERACKGPANGRFPYGRAFNGDACNTEDSGGTGRLVTFSGAYPKCVSGFGVFDLSGNVAEWVDAAGRPVAKGGAATSAGFAARCAARTPKAAGESDAQLGVRCCADPS